MIYVLTYANNDGDYTVLNASESFGKLHDKVMRRIRKFKRMDDEVRVIDRKRGNKITYIVFQWNDDDGKPTWHEAELAQVEQYTIQGFKG